MEIIYKQREKIVGLFFIGIVVLLLSSVVFIGRGQNWFRTYVIYYTIFKQGYNLQENAEVKLAKANIGKVRKISLSENKVKVELAILQEYASRVKVDSITTVESPTLIGDEYVSIKPGSKNAPPISEGGIIPSKEKKSITDFVDEFEIERISKLFIEAVQNLSEITGMLRDPKGPLFSTLDNVNVLVEDLQAGKGTVGNLLKSEDSLEDVRQIIENVNATTAKTPDTVDRVNENLVEFKQALIEIRESIGILKVTLKNLEEGSYDIPQVTESTKKGVQEIRDAVVNIDKVVQSAQKNFLIRQNIAPETEGENIDSGLR